MFSRGDIVRRRDRFIDCTRIRGADTTLSRRESRICARLCRSGPRTLRERPRASGRGGTDVRTRPSLGGRITMGTLPEFHNEAYLDFSRPENRKAMTHAMEKVRGELGREYDLLIGGERIRTGNLLKSVNPSRP